MALLRHYSIAEPLACELFSHGLNDIYRARTPAANFFLKVYGPSPTGRRDVEGEIQILLHLEKVGIPASRVVPQRSGHHFLQLDAPEGQRVAVLFAEMPGDPLTSCLNDESSKLYGLSLARLHKHVDQLSALRTTARTLNHRDPWDAVVNYLSEQYPTSRLHALREMIEALVTRVDNSLQAEGHTKGICHGDIHDLNAHLDSDGSLSILDFEDWHYGWRTYDLATFFRTLVLRHSLNLGDMAHGGIENDELFGCWQSFLTGYQQVRQLSRGEHMSIYALVPIRRAIEMARSVKNARLFGVMNITPQYLERGLKFMESWIDKYHLL